MLLQPSFDLVQVLPELCVGLCLPGEHFQQLLGAMKQGTGGARPILPEGSLGCGTPRALPAMPLEVYHVLVLLQQVWGMWQQHCQQPQVQLKVLGSLSPVAQQALQLQACPRQSTASCLVEGTLPSLRSSSLAYPLLYRGQCLYTTPESSQHWLGKSKSRRSR